MSDIVDEGYITIGGSYVGVDVAFKLDVDDVRNIIGKLSEDKREDLYRGLGIKFVYEGDSEMVDAHLDNESERKSLQRRVDLLEDHILDIEKDDDDDADATFINSRFKDIEFRLQKAEERLDVLDDYDK